MDDIFTLMLIAAFLSVVGGVVWWGLVIFGIYKVAQHANRQFEQQMLEAEAMLRTLPRMPSGQQSIARAQVMQNLTNLNAQWRQLDDLRRQQYDVRVGELSGMAASAGFDWTPQP